MSTSNTKSLWEARKAARDELEELGNTIGSRIPTQDENRRAAKLEKEIAALDVELDGALNSEIRDLTSGTASVVGGEQRSGLEDTILDAPAESRDLTEGTASQGGYLVTDASSSAIVNKIVLSSPVANLCRRIDVGTTDTLLIPRVSTQATAAQVSEAGTIAEGDPVFAQVSIPIEKAANLTDVSNEALADSAPALAPIITDQHVRAHAVNLESQIMEGDGSSPNVTGLRDAGQSINETGLTQTAADHSDVLAAVHRLEAEGLGRDELSIVMSPSLWTTLEDNLEGITNSVRYLHGDVTDVWPRRLFGVPVYLSAAIATNEGGGTNETYFVAGAFKYAALAVRKQLAVEVSRDFRFSTDQTSFRSIFRFGFKILDPAAFEIVDEIIPA